MHLALDHKSASTLDFVGALDSLRPVKTLLALSTSTTGETLVWAFGAFSHLRMHNARAAVVPCVPCHLHDAGVRACGQAGRWAGGQAGRRHDY